MKSSVAIVAVALTVSVPAVSAPIVFSDDFEDDTVGSNPAVSGSNIGLSWDSEINNVDVVANSLVAGNLSSQVLQGNFAGSNLNGEMDGNLLYPIFLSGASISFDFYLPGTGNAANDINVRLRTETGSGYLGPQFQRDGVIAGAGGAFNDTLDTDPNKIVLTHFGSGFWQNAFYAYTSTGNPGEYSIYMKITRLDTLEFVEGTGISAVAADVDRYAFTEVNPKFAGTAAFAAYIDNLSVEGVMWVPEPSMFSLTGLGLASALILRRRARPAA